jgi:hypothetical protein
MFRPTKFFKTMINYVIYIIPEYFAYKIESFIATFFAKYCSWSHLLEFGIGAVTFRMVKKATFGKFSGCGKLESNAINLDSKLDCSEPLL